jgi:hypothetical protein
MRFTAVRYPLQAATERRSSPIISLIVIFIGSISFCIVLSRSNQYVQCHEELLLGWFIADALTSFVVPFSLILIFNLLIISLIRKNARSPLTIPTASMQRCKYPSQSLPHRSHASDDSRWESYSMACEQVNSAALRQSLIELGEIHRIKTSDYLLSIREGKRRTTNMEPIVDNDRPSAKNKWVRTSARELRRLRST